MRTLHLAALVIAATAMFSTGCSKNEAATAACSASTDSESCNACCTKNGATGYKYMSGSTCSCLGGSGKTTSAASPSASTTK